MGDTRNDNKILVGKSEGNRKSGRATYGQENNI